MEILKFKKVGVGKYKVYFSKDNEYVLNEDIILKYNLLNKKEIDIKLLNEIVKSNNEAEAYTTALNYISYKLRTESEIRKKLTKQDYEKKVIDSVINRLKEEKYLNDEVYIKSFINDKINLSNIGPYKIKLELMSDFKEEKIEEELSKISEEIWIEKIKKIISKKEKLNNKLSAVALKKKIKNDLINLGYDIKLIDSYLVINEEDDYEIIKKEFIKQYMKHKKKLSGEALNYKIKSEMYKKGFTNINIIELLNEVE